MPFLATLNPFKSFETADQAQQGVAASRAACVVLWAVHGYQAVRALARFEAPSGEAA